MVSPPTRPSVETRRPTTPTSSSAIDSMRARAASLNEPASSTSGPTVRSSSPNASLWVWLVSESTRVEWGVRHAALVNSSMAPNTSRVNTEPSRGATAIRAVSDEA